MSDTNKDDKPQKELPKASVYKIIRKSLPEGMKVSKNITEKMLRASTIWILYITHLANKISKENKRVTIMECDVIEALKDSGFEDMINK